MAQRRKPYFWNYLGRLRGAELLTILLAVVCAGVCVYIFDHNLSNWDLWDVGLTTGTFATAIFVWIGERRQEWENSRPKRLTVCYLYPRDQDAPKIAMLCVDAYLAGESDIRALGLSIGQQVCGGLLKYLPNIQESPGRIEFDDNENEWLKKYEVVFQLWDEPRDKEGEVLVMFKNKACWLWRSPPMTRGPMDIGPFEFSRDSKDRIEIPQPDFHGAAAKS